MKRKILYIITIPDWGGAQKYVFDSANSQKNDCEVVVSAGKSERPSKINLFEKCKEANVATHQFKYLVRQINLLKDILAIFEIRNYLEGEGPDIVHSNSSKAGIIVSFAVASLKHKPKVVHAVHGWVFLEPMSAVKKWFYIFLERLASRWRDEIIVLGEKERQIAINYKICPQEKLRITKHAISEIKFLDGMDARNQLNLPQDKKIIGTIANFYPSKGLEYLIGAASKIDRPDTIFVVIGDGPKRSNYELLITNCKLQDKLLLLGEKENAAQYLRAFDVFILPSLKEGAPFVLLEAMAAELPIIATDVGNISEMLKDYQNKTIIPPANVGAAIEAMLKKI